MSLKLNLSIISFFLIPLLFFWNPSLFSLLGVQPYWPLFWLLPWAVIYGKYNGLLTGLLLGLILDSLNDDIYTQIPGLMICGLWFGKIGRSKDQFLTKWNYGLISSIGCLFCGLVYFVQVIYFKFPEKSIFWMSYGIKNIFSQVLLTGLLAPIFCSWLYFIFNNASYRKI